MHTIAPSAFFSQATSSSAQGQQQSTLSETLQSQAPAPAPLLTPEEREERKRQFKTSIHDLLQPSSFSGAQAVYQLTERIADYGTAEVDAQTRAEILARIRDGAGNHYYRAWSENPTAIDITREWIKAAAKSDNPLLVDTVMPLLHVRHASHL
jgi:protein phosphatase 1 regulatory subunit 10